MTAMVHRQVPPGGVSSTQPNGALIVAPGRAANRPHVVRQRPLCPRTGSDCVAGNATAAMPSDPTPPRQEPPAKATEPIQRRPNLSAREIEVLIAWLRTESKTAVGHTLYITAATVRTHIQRIREKYDAAGRPASTKAALTVRAIQDGLITVEDL